MRPIFDSAEYLLTSSNNTALWISSVDSQRLAECAWPLQTYDRSEKLFKSSKLLKRPRLDETMLHYNLCLFNSARSPSFLLVHGCRMIAEWKFRLWIYTWMTNAHLINIAFRYNDWWALRALASDESLAPIRVGVCSPRCVSMSLSLKATTLGKF